MGRPPDQARPPGNVWVWVVVVVVLLLCLLAGGGCLVVYLTLPPAEAPQWLAAAGLGLVALPWAFWTVTCAYRCCCSADAVAPASVDRQPSSWTSAVAPAPAPGGRSLKSALAGASAWRAEGSPSGSGGARRVRFGEATVLGEEEHAAAEEKDDGSSVHSNESEAPLAASMRSSSSSSSS